MSTEKLARVITRTIVIAALGGGFGIALASEPPATTSADAVWERLSAGVAATDDPGLAEPPVYALDQARLEAILATAPLEGTPEASTSAPTLTLPMPDGSYEEFSIVRSPILSAELAAINPSDGAIAWRKASVARPAFAMWNDGHFIVALDGDVVALDPKTGSERWRARYTTPIPPSPSSDSMR